MKLTRLDWCGYRIPFRRRFVAAGSSAPARHGLLLTLYADSGIAGFGEASPVGAGDEQTVKELSGSLPGVARLILGEHVADMSSLRSVACKLSGPPRAIRFGVETALLDLLGKALCKPVAALLGGTPRPVPVNALLTAEECGEAVAEAREAVAAGFTTLKLKVGISAVEADVRRVAAVRRAVGPGISLRIDANQAWTVEQAITAMGLLGPFGLEYVEQPVSASDISGLAAVRRSVSTPVAADEALAGIENAVKLMRMNAADFLIVKAARVGLLESLDITQLAAEARVPAVITSSLETDIGIAASLHLAAAMPPGGPACGLATGPLLENGLGSDPLTPSSGEMVCPARPGLGLAPDPAAVAKYSSVIKGSITA